MHNDLPPIKNLTPEEFRTWLADHSQPAFRERQIREWLYNRWTRDFADMANLPKALRAELADSFSAFSVREIEQVTGTDGATKYLLQLSDGETIETVLIPSAKRTTVCISTQVGCPVRCSFCASGQGGMIRDLSVWEIVDQVLFVCGELGERVGNIVVMGMGEPLLNLDNVIPALEAICSPDGVGIGARHVTVSTSGIAPGIHELANVGHQWNLAISLHAASDSKRARLIPPKHRFPLREILSACDDYRRKTGRMVTFEYALIAGINDSPDDLTDLAKIAREHRAKVNLIPCNATKGSYKSPDRGTVKRWMTDLESMRVRATVRWSRGADITAACGQLRRRKQA